MNYKDKQKAKERYQESRKNLIQLSKLSRLLIETGEVETVNEGLIYLYEQQNEGAEEWNTFNQWKQEGYIVAKGSKAFCVWGQPRHVIQTPEGATEPEEYKYWPLCYLFNNLQVIKPTPAESRPAEPEPEQEPAGVLEMDTILN